MRNTRLPRVWLRLCERPRAGTRSEALKAGTHQAMESVDVIANAPRTRLRKPRKSPGSTPSRHHASSVDPVLPARAVLNASVEIGWHPPSRRTRSVRQPANDESVAQLGARSGRPRRHDPEYGDSVSRCRERTGLPKHAAVASDVVRDDHHDPKAARGTSCHRRSSEPCRARVAGREFCGVCDQALLISRVVRT